MCTIWVPDETREARKMSADEAQARVDSLMARDRELSGAFTFTKEELKTLFEQENYDYYYQIFSLRREFDDTRKETQQLYSKFSSFLMRNAHPPFTKEDLKLLFERHDWGQAHGWRDYMVLTDAERKIVDELGLTPEEKALPEKFDQVNERENLKRTVSVTSIAGIVPDTTFYVLKFKNIFLIGFGNIFDTIAYSGDLKQLKEEIKLPLEDDFAVLLLKMLKSNHFALDKDKLHPDQISFLDSEFNRTMEISKSADLTILNKTSEKETYERQTARRMWSMYLLLNNYEKSLLDEMALTPVKPPEYEQKEPMSNTAVVKARIILKRQFDDITGIRVWLDCGNFRETRHKGFYYVRYTRELSMHSTAYDPPDLVVEKKKLRPDQVEYMERKWQENKASWK